jgi:hypothetical protein
MKSKFLSFVLALLICGMAFAVSQQSSRAQNTESQKTTSQNKKVTGTITKIDTKSQSITIRESSPSQHQTENKGETETFKYDTETRFVISGTGNYTGSVGTINDMKVGDSVVIMRDNSDLITSIQKINVFHNHQ